jgi:hypothetical protein
VLNLLLSRTRRAEEEGQGGGRKEYAREYHFLWSYGLTKEARDKLREQQDHKCGICRQGAKLVVDHNHENGHVRGLLCDKCNMGLGLFRDSPDILLAAAAYLRPQP